MTAGDLGGDKSLSSLKAGKAKLSKPRSELCSTETHQTHKGTQAESGPT